MNNLKTESLNSDLPTDFILKNVTDYSYDESGRFISKRCTDGSMTQRSYTETGEVELRTSKNKRGQTVVSKRISGKFGLLSVDDGEGGGFSIEYDEQGRPVLRTDSDGDTFKWFYSNVGSIRVFRRSNGFFFTRLRNLKEQETLYADSNGTTRALSYDTEGRLISENVLRGEGFLGRYVLDPSVSQQIEDDRRADFERGNKGRSERLGITLGGHDISENMKEFPLRGPCYHNDPKEIAPDYPFNPCSRTWLYDVSGNMTHFEDKVSGYTSVRTYDDKNRMVTHVGSNGWSEEFEYSETGATLREKKFWNGQPYTSETIFNKDMQLLRFIDNSGAISENTYDDAGLMTSQRSGKEFIAFKRDESGRLLGQSFSSKESTKIELDAAGNEILFETSSYRIVRAYNAHNKCIRREWYHRLSFPDRHA